MDTGASGESAALGYRVSRVLLWFVDNAMEVLYLKRLHMHIKRSWTVPHATTLTKCVLLTVLSMVPS